MYSIFKLPPTLVIRLTFIKLCRSFYSFILIIIFWFTFSPSNRERSKSGNIFDFNKSYFFIIYIIIYPNSKFLLLSPYPQVQSAAVRVVEHQTTKYERGRAEKMLNFCVDLYQMNSTNLIETILKQVREVRI